MAIAAIRKTAKNKRGRKATRNNPPNNARNQINDFLPSGSINDGKPTQNTISITPTRTRIPLILVSCPPFNQSITKPTTSRASPLKPTNARCMFKSESECGLDVLRLTDYAQKRFCFKSLSKLTAWPISCFCRSGSFGISRSIVREPV